MVEDQDDVLLNKAVLVWQSLAGGIRDTNSKNFESSTDSIDTIDTLPHQSLTHLNR